MGVINVGGEGIITADGTEHRLQKLDSLYLGRGVKDVCFSSAAAENPAHFFILSAPAHQAYPSTLMKSSEATPVELGSPETANERTIFKYIHEDGIKSCQVVMGLTVLKPGSVWNTMPPHTHNRRMEVYLYFDVKAEHRVFHFMGEPTETRHLVVANHEAVISAPWSIHSGCGTSNYSFIWGMAGENQSFADMDGVAISELQ
jgi:4-deoxy-L-threo-5-hexosulose-uronate ketol-isomerase